VPLLPFCLYQICFLYRLSSNLTISSAIVPSRRLCTSSSISACRKAPGISVMTTYLPSFASIAHDSTIASSNMVGKLTSSFVVYSLCGHPSAHPRALSVPSCFSFKNMRYLKAFFFCTLSCLIIELVLLPFCHVIVLTL